MEHFCEVHHCAFKKYEKEGKFWYSHKKPEPEGGWCNEPKEGIETKPAPVIQPATVAESTLTMTDDKWKEKDRITRKSIERQTALNVAGRLVETGKIEPGQLLLSAKRFEAFLETGIIEKEVQKANRIVEAAKKMNVI